MAMTDPLGDMLTRIRNAQMRKMSKVLTPASKLRQNVLDVLASEGYIRGYASMEQEGKSEFEIELKYFDGEPVIRTIERVSKPRAPRLCVGEKSSARGQRSGSVDSVDASRRDGRPRSSRHRTSAARILCRVF